MNLTQMILSSGLFVQLVLFLLLLASVISWGVAFKKYRELKLIKGCNQVFGDIYKNHKKLNDIFEQARDFPIHSNGHLFIKGYEEFLRISDGHSQNKEGEDFKRHYLSFGPESVKRALRIGINEVNETLDSKLSVLASIGAICPFLGLFGTVWGIINSFMGIAEGGTTLDAVAPGVAEALITTAVGLIAAIPAVLFYNYFSSENSKVNLKMENFSQEFLNMLDRLVMNFKQ